MDFYQAIAYRYDHIFPFSPKQKEFVLGNLKDPEAAEILEIGCATGSLTLELAKDCRRITGLDIDGTLLSFARTKALKSKAHVQFIELDMLEIAKDLSAGLFDSICCFGNTLVHLDNKSEMLDFFMSAKTLLKEDAPLHIQIINYDRILDDGITSLPTIENEFISFIRTYEYLEDEHRIAFSTILTDKMSGSSSSQMVKLYPLRRKELEELLQEAGFMNYTWFGGFDRTPLERTSVPLIISAR